MEFFMASPMTLYVQSFHINSKVFSKILGGFCFLFCFLFESNLFLILFQENLSQSKKLLGYFLMVLAIISITTSNVLPAIYCPSLIFTSSFIIRAWAESLLMGIGELL